MNTAYQTRIEAVKRYNSGEKPAVICKSLGKARSWFFFWVKRYNPKDENWFKDQSRANRTIHNKTDKEIETLICNIRKKLFATKYSQIGAFSIQWELKKMGLKKLPPIWTINRILKRQNLLKKSMFFEKQGRVYPSIKAAGPNILHQFDLIGPRYLGKGIKNRFYAFNIIDSFSNYVSTNPYPGKKDDYIIDFMLKAWSVMGTPAFLQVDNELSFKGSNRHPRTFGKLIKLCLYFGVEITFVPEAEPWRQGVIEKFNDIYDKLFFRKQVFDDFSHLEKESPIFEDFHNRKHFYSKLKGKTPGMVHVTPRAMISSRLKKQLSNEIPFKNGKVSFVRLTNAEGKIRFFTETFLVDKRLVHEYVKGTIVTRNNQLKFYYHNKLVKTILYTVNKY